MESTQDLGVEFYDILGKLFYAVAASDGIVSASEIKSLERMVRSHWICMEEVTDLFSNCLPKQIVQCFERARFKKLDVYECLEEFKYFKLENPQLFMPDVNKLIWSTANVIAHCYPGFNESEAVVLTKLQEVLED
ncbi:MAG: hypothetical protein V7767_12450 [Leeuwenhoekiella sp.]